MFLAVGDEIEDEVGVVAAGLGELQLDEIEQLLRLVDLLEEGGELLLLSLVHEFVIKFIGTNHTLASSLTKASRSSSTLSGIFISLAHSVMMSVFFTRPRLVM
jgi:hypothetical protein